MIVMGKKKLMENSVFENEYESRVSLVCLGKIAHIILE